MLDTVYTIETPEGVALQLRLAGPVVRALAWLIDFGLRCIGYIVLALLFFFGDLGTGLFLISMFILEWFYPVLFERYYYGATPGKKIMHIKVLHELGTPVNGAAAMIRNLLRPVDFLPFLYGLGLMSMLINKNFKRLGDLAAGTVVVYQDTAPHYLALPEATPIPTPQPLTFTEQQAIIDFAQRAPTLSPQRAMELAEIVMPLTGGRDVETLYQIAHGLIGDP